MIRRAWRSWLRRRLYGPPAIAPLPTYGSEEARRMALLALRGAVLDRPRTGLSR